MLIVKLWQYVQFYVMPIKKIGERERENNQGYADISIQRCDDVATFPSIPHISATNIVSGA